ncbi:hypothetical protein ROLI_020290 [Roseobacter fucihabitans]|uniref:DUF2059 domain-containing protein n=1 Tax=Roseobacter fucihabitans TaxID=1537242 RepID=A0ABZ2BSD3_9RHOB|nr:hypothetical protein [Roseobacter litoralis]MBC6966556.1 hypothetical protein [Roseobacter litoralis]
MRAFALSCVMCFCAMSAWADARVTVLMDALRLSDLAQIIQEEGLADAAQINADMLAGQGGTFWEGQVAALYDPTVMLDGFHQALLARLQGDRLQTTVTFFDSVRGQKIVALEIAAREAMVDTAVQDAASEAFAALQAHQDPYVDFATQLLKVNDLLEFNVAVTMSTSYQFYRGLSDGGFLRQSEAEILSDVWASEADVRREAQTWLHAYFLLAYQPLDPSDRQAYLAFLQSPAGQALNNALFAGFEGLFKDIAYGLGRAVALNAVGNDI